MCIFRQFIYICFVLSLSTGCVFSGPDVQKNAFGNSSAKKKKSISVVDSSEVSDGEEVEDKNQTTKGSKTSKFGQKKKSLKPESGEDQGDESDEEVEDEELFPLEKVEEQPRSNKQKLQETFAFIKGALGGIDIRLLEKKSIQDFVDIGQQFIASSLLWESVGDPVLFDTPCPIGEKEPVILCCVLRDFYAEFLKELCRIWRVDVSGKDLFPQCGNHVHCNFVASYRVCLDAIDKVRTLQGRFSFMQEELEALEKMMFENLHSPCSSLKPEYCNHGGIFNLEFVRPTWIMELNDPALVVRKARCRDSIAELRKAWERFRDFNDPRLRSKARGIIVAFRHALGFKFTEAQSNYKRNERPERRTPNTDAVFYGSNSLMGQALKDLESMTQYEDIPS